MFTSAEESNAVLRTFSSQDELYTEIEIGLWKKNKVQTFFFRKFYGRQQTRQC